MSVINRAPEYGGISKKRRLEDDNTKRKDMELCSESDENQDNKDGLKDTIISSTAPLCAFVEPGIGSSSHTDTSQEDQNLARGPPFEPDQQHSPDATEHLKQVLKFRGTITSRPLEGAMIPKCPLSLFALWFREAITGLIAEPGVMCLTTVSGTTHRPSARFVMLQGFDRRGFVFYTNSQSRKAKEVRTCPFGDLSFNWIELQRCVRVSGVIEPVSEQESVEYFMKRPRLSQIGAWALDQSQPVESNMAMQKKVVDMNDKMMGMEVPRPQNFGGYRLRPDQVEFWHGRASKLHDRIVYVLINDKWRIQRLSP